MPSPERTRGRNRYLQPIQLIVAGLAGFSTFLYPLIFSYTPRDEPIGSLIIGVMSAGCLVGGVVLLCHRYRREPQPTATEMHMNALLTASPARAARLFRFRGWAFGVLWALWSALVGYELTRLQLGWAESVRTVWPIPHIHQSLGYWPAVLLFPVLGVPIFLVLELRLRRHLRAIKASQTGHGPNPG